jgi:hypothetical protein
MPTRAVALVAVIAALAMRWGPAAAEDAQAPTSPTEAGRAAAGDFGLASVQIPEGCIAGPQWRVRANILSMRLSRPNDTTLVTNFTPGGSVLLDAAEFKFSEEVGPEIAILRQINEDWSVEGRFFRIGGWSASRGPVDDFESDIQYTTPFRIGVPSPNPIVFDTTIAGMYLSELTNVELNGRRRINDFWSLLLGFRYLGLDDNLTIQQGVNFDTATFTHNIGAVNELYGFQIGADMNLWSRGRLSVEGLLKAGLYGDHATNRVHIGLTNSPLTADSNAVADSVAFVGEMSITGVYRFGEHFSLRAGYQLLWLEGVAQASDQVANSDPLAGTASVAFQGGPLYDGAFLGIEFAH